MMSLNLVTTMLTMLAPNDDDDDNSMKISILLTSKYQVGS